jgi:ubiquinone/menaquinone biosynthesis C-methylase UbiE
MEACMTKIDDQEYLLNEQYRDAQKLNARVRLHMSFSLNRYGWFHWVFDHFDLAPAARILELGCGPGDLWRENKNRIPDGWTITLSDFSSGMLDQARRNLSDHPHPFVFRQIDAQDIPCEDGSFHAVIANHCLYHVPDRAKALTEICRVLAPNGWLFATTVGINHLREMDELVEGFVPGTQDVFRNSQNPFTLENGEVQLQPWFSDIRVDRYPDALHVTESSPLVDFVFSTVRHGLDERQRPAFTTFIEGKIDAHGMVKITKDSGMFTARKL